MERLLSQLGNVAFVGCLLACTCIVLIFVVGVFIIRRGVSGLVPMVADLIIGRVDQTPEGRTPPTSGRPAGAVLKAKAQSLDFDEALRRQGAPPTILAQGAPQQAAYPQQPSYGAQSAPAYNQGLQNIAPIGSPQLSGGTIQPLYDNRVQTSGNPSYPAPNMPSLTGSPYQPLGGGYPQQAAPNPSYPAAPYQPLGGGYQQQSAPSGSADPNAFFPTQTGGIPRRASLSAPRDVSGGAMGDAGFSTDNYPGLRNRPNRRRDVIQDTRDTDKGNEDGIGGVIGNMGNMLGL